MKLRFTWRPTAPQALSGLLSLVAVGLLLYRLGSLVSGLAANEQVLPTFRASLQTIWHNPLLLPYRLSQLFVAAVLPTGGYTASRLPAVLLGIIMLGLLYWVLKQWYGQRLAIFGAALVVSAPWFLHVSRLANGTICYPLAMAVVLGLAAAWHKNKRPLKLIYISSIAAALMLYVPGVIWLLICLIAVEHKHLYISIKTARWHAGIAAALGLVILLPLMHALAVHWPNYSLYLGGPAGWPTLIDYPQHYLSVWLHIFIGDYHNPVYNLGGLPVVSIFMSLSFVVGIYLYGQHRSAARPRLLALLWLVGTALISLPGTINLSLILPILIVLATGGIGYLLHLWLKVFPRNPIARGVGIGLIGLVVIFAATYNLTNYFIAWPHNSATQAAFSRRL